MMHISEKTETIRRFILDHVSEHPGDIAQLTAEAFGISRQAAARHLRRLIDEGLLSVEGKTRDRRYALRPIADIKLELLVTPDLEEDRVWREHFLPHLAGVKPGVLGICGYGFTEMLNNVIDHSEATLAIITMMYSAAEIYLTIWDNGIGIFHKIQRAFGLADERDAILELAKGKLTTDPARHTGEGIFFTSRSFDYFAILSGRLYFSHERSGNDWLLEDDQEGGKGTLVSLKIHPSAKQTLQEVLDYYAAAEDDYGFSRTIVPVKLARYGEEQLVSRSQAKRLLARVERFKEVLLDFQDVDAIGQAFADEVFRVYAREHPDVHLTPMNMSEPVRKMVMRTLRQE